MNAPVQNDLFAWVAVFLLISLLAALVRIVRGPSAADRLLAAMLFGTTGVAILLLLALANERPALIDVALVFALLAAITGATFAQRVWHAEAGATEREHH